MVEKALHDTKHACLCISAGTIIALPGVLWLTPLAKQSRASAHASGAASWALPGRTVEQAAAPDNVSQIDLGTVRAGGWAERQFWLVNSGNSPIDIKRIKTSCECVSVELPERHIAPHQSVTATLRLDLSDDLDFTGGLCPEIGFFDEADQEVFTYMAEAVVATRPRLHDVSDAGSHADRSDRLFDTE